MLPISIGCDAACSIALEDPNKHMSRFHVEIAEEEDGTYWMSVVSKVNPVMVLPEAAPAGPAPPLADPQELGTSTQIRRSDEAERLFNESTFLGDEKPAPPPEETFVPRKVAPAPPSHPLRASGAISWDVPGTIKALERGPLIRYCM